MPEIFQGLGRRYLPAASLYYNPAIFAMLNNKFLLLTKETRERTAQFMAPSGTVKSQG
jgi:hypothetical protein